TVTATDAAGNTSPAATSTYVLDTTAPVAPTITAAPVTPGNGRSPSWSFTSKAGATFTCSIMRGGVTVFRPATCTSPTSYDLTSLPDALPTFTVTATDAAGNTSPAATSTYVLDTTAPVAPTITAAPVTPGNGRSPSWSFTGEAEIGRASCRDRGEIAVSPAATDSSPKSIDLTVQPDA